MRLFGSMLTGFYTGFLCGFFMFCPETSPLKMYWHKNLMSITESINRNEDPLKDTNDPYDHIDIH